MTFDDDVAQRTIALRVTDDLGAVSIDTTTLRVKNVKPTLALNPEASIEDHGTYATFTASGSFTDPGSDTWTATVDYADGDGPQPLTLNADNTFDLVHDYQSLPDGRAYKIKVTVTDDDGGKDSRIDGRLIVIGTLGGDRLKVKRGSVIVDWNDQTIGTFDDVTQLIVWGGGGNDEIVVEPNVLETTILLGGEGDDTIIGGGGDNTIDGGPGDDLLVGGLATNLLLGGAGNDTIQDGSGSNTVVGGPGSNTFVPGDGQSTFESEPGSTLPEVFADAYDVAEDNRLSVAAAGVLANDLDPTGAGLTCTLVSDTTHGTLSLNADGSFGYLPDQDFNGTDSFTYVASNGTETSSEATVTIQVTPVNDLPVATLTGSTGSEHDGQNQQFTWNASDVDENLDTVVLAVTQDGSPLESLSGPVDPSGSLDFNHLGLGQFAVTITATDTDGETAVATRTVTVTDDDTSGPAITLGGSSGTGLEIDTNEFTWNVTDDSGLSALSVIVTPRQR